MRSRSKKWIGLCVVDIGCVMVGKDKPTLCVNDDVGPKDKVRKMIVREEQ